jgi:hypothetical protein
MCVIVEKKPEIPTISKGLLVHAMDLGPIRAFLLTSYHDLPNILFVGSLLLGALMGHLPLVWMAIGLVFNWVLTTGLQMVVALLGGMGMKWPGQFTMAYGPACAVGFQQFVQSVRPAAVERVVAPSMWLSTAAFFAVFSIYNSIRVAGRKPAKGVDPAKVSERRAFSLSTFLVGLIFLGFICLRGFTGCETLVGGVSGAVVGSGAAIAFWHILDAATACGEGCTGKVPDLLQVIGSMAPEGNGDGKTTPMVCTTPSSQ